MNGFYRRNERTVKELSIFCERDLGKMHAYSLDKKIPVLMNGNFLAEAVGFEPTSLLRGYLISSQGRYDHFDTLPYSVLREAKDRSGHNVHAVGGT